MRPLGMWKVPVDLGKARTLVEDGAMVVDVRSQVEYAEESLDCTINLPLENLDSHTE